jgi:hypothetical protein
MTTSFLGRTLLHAAAAAAAANNNNNNNNNNNKPEGKNALGMRRRG